MEAVGKGIPRFYAIFARSDSTPWLLRRHNSGRHTSGHWAADSRGSGRQQAFKRLGLSRGTQLSIGRAGLTDRGLAWLVQVVAADSSFCTGMLAECLCFDFPASRHSVNAGISVANVTEARVTYIGQIVGQRKYGSAA